MHIFFSDFLRFDTSLLLLTVTLLGVSNKHCLLSFLLFMFLNISSNFDIDSLFLLELKV